MDDIFLKVLLSPSNCLKPMTKDYCKTLNNSLLFLLLLLSFCVVTVCDCECNCDCESLNA